MSYTQDERKFSVETPLGQDFLLFRGITGREGLSRLFEYQVRVLGDNRIKVPFEAILGKSVTVAMKMGLEETPCFLNGICHEMSQGGRDDTFTTYSVGVVPSVWLLTKKSQSRVFQHLSVPDILRKIFQGYDVSWELTGRYEQRDYCVQYRESDFDFGSRLMEEEGIFYFFKHEDGSHMMVVSDDSSTCPSVPGPSEVKYEELAGGVRDEERIYVWEKRQQIRSGTVTLWDHTFQLPHKHLDAQQPIVASVPAGTITHKHRVGGNEKLEIYDSPGGYAQRFDGIDAGGGERPQDIQKVFEDNKRTAAIRMDAETVPGLVIQGETSARQMRSGHQFTLASHFNANGPYLVVESGMEAEETGDYRSGVSELKFKATLSCVPFATRFRPARTTQKPLISGSQTAIVVGPKGEEIFTDKYGRVKVQFHWDREGKNDATSSCWIRVAHVWAGTRWGGIHIPRIGMEVLVAFLDGDPDQPMIVGTVYNAREMPPYDLPANKTQSGVKSRSTLAGGTEDFNELRFEDKKGKEEIYFHAQKDFTRIVEHDDDLEVGNDQTILIKRDRKEQVDRNEEVLVRKNRDHHIESNDGLWVDGSKGRAIRITNGKQILTIDLGDNLIEVKTGDMKTTLDQGNHTLQLKAGNMETILDMGNDTIKLKMGDMKTTLDMGNLETRAKLGNISTKADLGKINEQALQGIEMKVAGSSVRIDPMGVTIKGMMVKIEGQVMTDVKGMITKVDGSAMLRAGGGITMIG